MDMSRERISTQKLRVLTMRNITTPRGKIKCLVKINFRGGEKEVSPFPPGHLFLVEFLEKDVILPATGDLGGAVGGELGPDGGIDLVPHFEIVGNGILDAEERPPLVGEVGQIIFPEGIDNPVRQVGDAVFGDMHVRTCEW
jgi:hypothetical protein